MRIYHNPSQALHRGRKEMYRGRLVDCVEVPQRTEIVLQALAQRGFGKVEPVPEPDMRLIEAIHSAGYLDFLRTAWCEWVALDPANEASDILPSLWPNHGLRRDVAPMNFSAKVGRFTFDAGSPITSGTWTAAVEGAACAIEAAREVANASARSALVVTRPPGHHAGRDYCGGYCFLNNSALAAQALRDAGHARVAVLDVDYHHGNGTQAIFYERGDVFTVSLHGDPHTEYPYYLGYADERGEGAGEGANLNLPLARGTGFREWREVLGRAMEGVARFGATAVVVALGVDTFSGDPIAGFGHESADFLAVGRALASMQLPTVMVLEGGYAVEAMGVNVANVAEGFTR